MGEKNWIRVFFGGVFEAPNNECAKTAVNGEGEWTNMLCTENIGEKNWIRVVSTSGKVEGMSGVSKLEGKVLSLKSYHRMQQ